MCFEVLTEPRGAGLGISVGAPPTCETEGRGFGSPQRHAPSRSRSGSTLRPSVASEPEAPKELSPGTIPLGRP